MPTQLALRFDQVPVTCPAQEHYHTIAPCLAGLRSPAELAAEQNLGYSTVTRWLRDFRAEGLPGLFPATEYPREPYTSERVIVMLVYFKCLVPKASERELARVIQSTLEHTIHHETVKALLKRYFFWQYPEFRQALQYPKPTDPEALRLEMQRLWQQEISRVPHRSLRKVYLGAIHAILILQKKYGYAGWFRIKGYLESDYGISMPNPKASNFILACYWKACRAPFWQGHSPRNRKSVLCYRFTFKPCCGGDCGRR